jgi:hypothetical protein
LGEAAEASLRRVLDEKPTLEVRKRAEELLRRLEAPVTDPDRLRAIRAAEVLERIGSPEAISFLKELAGGYPSARLTREAQASLKRLKSKPLP